MNKYIILLVLLGAAIPSDAQVPPPLAIKEYKRGLNPVDEIPLFDQAEIKQREIDTAYIIYHPASWAEYDSLIHPCTCPYSDTMALYRFDSEGRIMQQTSFLQAGDYADTDYYDTSGNLTARGRYKRKGNASGTNRIFPYARGMENSRIEIIRSMEGVDSLITEIVFFKFSHGMDTAFVKTKRYNQQGQLTEEISNDEKNADELGDDSGEGTYHFAYAYDGQGRLIYYRDFEYEVYEKISYPFYGKLTEEYTVHDNRLSGQRIKMIQEVDGVITVTLYGNQITLVPLEKGSKLYKLKATTSSGDMPLTEYYEIVYK